MRMLMTVTMPIEPFNTLVRAGRAGQILGEILAEIKPEAAYFTAVDCKRSSVLVIDLKQASDIPKFAEPFFLHFNANVDFKPVMTPADLQQAGLAELGKRWGGA